MIKIFKFKNNQLLVPKEDMDLKDMTIRDIFIKLTSFTYPYGFEDKLAAEMSRSGLFPSDIKKDTHGNYFYEIGKSRTIFASHLDTACRDHTIVNHIQDGNIIKTDGKSILGADDKAGVTIMIHMMNNKIPGLYYFFIGEEVGCVGSGAAAVYGDFKGKYDRIISFDRRDLFSVITHQSSTRCCSDEFANQLADEINKSGLKYKKDDTGVYTDSAEFTDIIPECTNLSVGYYKEHTTDESQDIVHLEKLSNACLNIDWENLVTKRDPSKKETKSYSAYSGYNSYRKYGDYGWGGNDWRNRGSISTKKTYGYYDDWYEEENRKKTRRSSNKKSSKVYYDKGDGELVEFKNVNIYGYDSDSVSLENNILKDDHKTNYYEWIKTKLIDEKLTKDELEIIRDQYLDMDDHDDKKFYECISIYF